MIFHLGDVSHQRPRVFHLNSWKFTIVWNVTIVSQRVDNTIENYDSYNSLNSTKKILKYLSEMSVRIYTLVLEYEGSIYHNLRVC